MKSEHYTSLENSLSRSGFLETRHGKLHLPSVIPVLKPVKFDKYWFTLLKEKLTDAFMINASILLNSPIIEEVLKKGIHSYLNYEGVVFCDSGGYSKFSRDIQQDKLLDVQLRLGVDIITTLDYPTQLSKTWVRRDMIRKSVDNALIAGENIDDEKNVLIFASVHGPSSNEIKNTITFLERYSSFDGYAVGSLLSIKSDYKRIVDLIIAARRATNKHLHAYGIVGSATYPLMFYLGVDSVDSQGTLLSGGTRHFYVPGKTDIHYKKLEMSQWSCPCKVCTNQVAQNLSLREKIALHNFLTVQREVKLIQRLIMEGSYEEYLKDRFATSTVLKRAFKYASRKIKRIL